MVLSLLLSGDSILQRRLNSRDDAELRPLFDKVRAADVAFTNLEVLANDYRGDPALESGGSHFGAPAWVLDELVEGRIVNAVSVDGETAAWAKVALERMLANKA